MSQETTAVTQTARSTVGGADQMVDRIHTASLDRLIAALPDAADQSMRNAIPLYAPEKAAEFTAAMTAELRAAHAATEAFNALVAQHGLDVEVLDPSTLGEPLCNKVIAFYAEHKDGDRVLCVLDGQDPTTRLHAARQILAHLEATA